jgi:hypothetical protein
LFEQFLPQRDPVGIVHRKDFDRRSTLGGLPDQERAFPSKMSRPSLNPGIEESRDLPRLRVDTRQVRPLVEIAPQAALGEIAKVVATPVLPCDDVLDLIGSDDVGFGEMAVLASIECPPANFLPEGFVHV